MNVFFNKVFFNLLVILFCLQSVFTTVQSTVAGSQDVSASATQNSGNIDFSQAIVSDEFLQHVVDQHFGLQPNSYANYTSIGGMEKNLRSEFILKNETIVGKELRADVRRIEVEKAALHIYLFEMLNYPMPTMSQKTIKRMVLKLNALDYSPEFCDDNKIPEKAKNARKACIQEVVDLLNRPDIWDKIQTIISALPEDDVAIAAGTGGPAVTYAQLKSDISTLRSLIVSSSSNAGGITSDKFVAIKTHLSNIIRLQNDHSPNSVCSFDLLKPIAASIQTYAFARSGNRQCINGRFDMYCSITPPFPQNVLRIVSQTPWYRPATSDQPACMTSMEQRPDANKILVGFHLAQNPLDIQTGRSVLHYTTMYPILCEDKSSSGYTHSSPE